MVNQTFHHFMTAVHHAKGVTPFKGVLMALDPGETTGWAVFDATQGIVRMKCGQIKTWPMEDAVGSFTQMLDKYTPSMIMHESYRVYDWKAESHSWSGVPTIRVIGCLETLCIQRNIPYYTQSAQQAKNFCTDEKLKSWDVYATGQKHARDAIRHGCLFLLFGLPSKDS